MQMSCRLDLNGEFTKLEVNRLGPLAHLQAYRIGPGSVGVCVSQLLAKTTGTEKTTKRVP